MKNGHLVCGNNVVPLISVLREVYSQTFVARGVYIPHVLKLDDARKCSIDCDYVSAIRRESSQQCVCEVSYELCEALLNEVLMCLVQLRYREIVNSKMAADKPIVLNQKAVLRKPPMAIPVFPSSSHSHKMNQ